MSDRAVALPPQPEGNGRFEMGPDAMRLDRNGLEILDAQECRALLGQVQVGRVGLSIRAMPVVLPVNFALLDNAVVVRTSAGSKFEAACDRAIVAFEADGLDIQHHTGWSVLVQGRADLIDCPPELADGGVPSLEPWGNPDADSFVQIGMDLISGRRVRRPDHG